jgi:diaminopimelate decarboxylase
MTSAAAIAVPHTAIAGFPVVGGEISIGGVALTRLAQRVGATPFFAYDRELISARVAMLRKVLPRAVRLHYSLKANPMPALVGHMAGSVDGFDVASAAELRTALNAGMRPEGISFSGPGKSDAELAQAVAAGICVNIESAREAAALMKASRDMGLAPRVAVRINPDFEVKASGMKMGGGAQQFGIDADQVPALLAEIADGGLDWLGLQIFAASQNLRGELIAQALRQSYALAVQLAAHGRKPLRSLNLGGGFGIPYFPGEQPLDLAPIAAELAEIANDAASRFPQAQLNLELGRYLVGEAGVYVARVVDKKISRGQVFLVLDGGMNHHLAASGNLGQVIRRNYPVVIGARMDQAHNVRPVSIVGPLCTPLDRLADQVPLPEAEVGDLVVVLQSGAYGASASPSAFLGHPPALEVLV